MKNNLPYLINIPPFLLKDLKETDLSFYSKLFLILKGKFFGFVIKFFNGNIFCYIMNCFFRNDGKIFFKEGKYLKLTNNKVKLFYPNKRVLRVMRNAESHLDRIYQSYCIESIGLKNGDTVIDCGANIGELNLAIKNKKVDINYIGFEPELITFECLKLNVSEKNDKLINKALSDSNEVKKLYLDSYGGNSSLESFGSSDYIEIETIKLDEFETPTKIKLLKIEAEGHEPEVLRGAVNTLGKTKYISVDFGAERGEDEDYTIVDVNQFLYENNFKLIEFSEYRFIGLYENTSI